MSIASPSLWNALNNSQYDAYNFTNAEAREKLFIFALLADLLKTFRLLARELAARPLEATGQLPDSSHISVRKAPEASRPV